MRGALPPSTVGGKSQLSGNLPASAFFGLVLSRRPDLPLNLPLRRPSEASPATAYRPRLRSAEPQGAKAITVSHKV